MIYSDGIHVISDVSLTELHRWAEDVGISRIWFHRGRGRHPHYDLPKRRRQKPLPGVTLCTSRRIVQMLSSLAKGMKGEWLVTHEEVELHLPGGSSVTLPVPKWHRVMLKRTP